MNMNRLCLDNFFISATAGLNKYFEGTWYSVFKQVSPRGPGPGGPGKKLQHLKSGTAKIFRNFSLDFVVWKRNLRRSRHQKEKPYGTASFGCGEST